MTVKRIGHWWKCTCSAFFCDPADHARVQVKVKNLAANGEEYRCKSCGEPLTYWKSDCTEAEYGQYYIEDE